MGLSFKEQLQSFGFEEKSKPVKKKKPKTKAKPINKKTPIPTQISAEKNKKEIKQQVRALLTEGQLNVEDADVPFLFNHCNRARKIFVTREQQQLLGQGELAIMILDRKSHLISKVLAEKIKKIAPIYPIALLDNTIADEENNIDEKYQVPDDLIW